MLFRVAFILNFGFVLMKRLNIVMAEGGNYCRCDDGSVTVAAIALISMFVVAVIDIN